MPSFEKRRFAPEKSAGVLRVLRGAGLTIGLVALLAGCANSPLWTRSSTSPTAEQYQAGRR